MSRQLGQLARTPVSTIEGRGMSPRKPVTAAIGEGLDKAFGITSVLDLVTTYPYRIHDRSRQAGIRSLRPGDEAWIEVTVRSTSSRRSRSGRSVFSYLVTDGSGSMTVSFFTPRHHRMKEGRRYVLFGKFELFGRTPQMTHPQVVPVGGADARLVAVYRQSDKYDIESQHVEGWVHEALDRAGTFLDPVPEEVVDRFDLIDRTAAFNGIHRPASNDEWHAARKRLVFDELLRIQLALVLRKQVYEESALGIRHVVDGTLVDRFVARLPYELTAGQVAAIAEVIADLAGPHPMHRLLQADVGAGKTSVAVAAMLTAVQGGHQAALLAPTEVLAEQHAAGIRSLLDGFAVPVGEDAGMLFDQRPLAVELLTNRTTAKERARLADALADGTADVVIGTHALLEEGVRFRSLGVVVIDEQHRFGVEQRAALRAKGAEEVVPDVLVMTATPIPRTAAMTVYGDLDLTVIPEKPLGRAPVVTTWEKVAGGDQLSLDDLVVWQTVRDEVAAGYQAFVVCPLIEESEKLEVRSAQATYDELAAGPLADLRIGLLHGRLKPAERDLTMDLFRTGGLDVLVATTVIEVGVDIPNASVMVVLDADRFGIAQLHQLRGRVGRGAAPSRCILVGAGAGEEGERRLQAMVDSDDGFALAEVDLEVRGEGTVFAARQKGRTDLKLASITRDRAVVEQAREVAFELVGADPGLAGHPELLAEVEVFLDEEQRDYLERS